MKRQKVILAVKAAMSRSAFGSTVSVRGGLKVYGISPAPPFPLFDSATEPPAKSQNVFIGMNQKYFPSILTLPPYPTTTLREKVDYGRPELRNSTSGDFAVITGVICSSKFC